MKIQALLTAIATNLKKLAASVPLLLLAIDEFVLHRARQHSILSPFSTGPTGSITHAFHPFCALSFAIVARTNGATWLIGGL